MGEERLDWLYSNSALGVEPPSEESPAASNPVPQQSGRSSTRKKNPLSCNLCRRRKVKCDKGNPCSHCVRAGEVCISPAPSGAPRGRQGGRRKLDRELMARLAKLESLVKNIEPSSPERSPTAPAINSENHASHTGIAFQPTAVDAPTSGHRRSREGLDRFLGSNTWMNLSDEIYGLREVLEQSSEDEEEEDEMTPDFSSQSPEQSGLSSFVIRSPETLSHSGIVQPKRSQVLGLYSAFMKNVHFAVAVLHGPSLRRYLVGESQRLDCSPGPKGLESLRFAIYYISVMSLTDQQCLSQLGERKSVLIPRFRVGTENALAKIDFVNTEDLSTLQALLFYLFALRSNENSRRTWTLTGLAVRISQALELHHEHEVSERYSRNRTPFMREMRRRLWWEILCLDRNGAVDRGSDMIVSFEIFTTPLPLNVNDDDLSPDDTREVHTRAEHTDMTLSLLCHEIFATERLLNRIPVHQAVNLDVQSDDPWAQRRGWVEDCQKQLDIKYLQHINLAIPAQVYTRFVADIMMACLWLWTYRPLQRHPNWPKSVQVPPPGVLYYAVAVMNQNSLVCTDANIGPYKWISRIWVQWHALAVMLAELCVETEGPTVERAWVLADSSYETISHYVADGEKGRLYRPIKKLMNKAKTVRRQYLESVSLPQQASVMGQTPDTASLSWPDAAIPSSTTSTIGMGDASFSMPGVEQGALPEQFHGDSILTSWEPWTGTTTASSSGYANGLDQIAWTNWESFIDDFQGPGNPSPPDVASTQPLYDYTMRDYGPSDSLHNPFPG